MDRRGAGHRRRPRALRHPANGGTDDVELGYYLGRTAWGRGFATECAEASLRFGFERIKLQRIVAVTRVRNAASQRVLEKVGMTFAGKFTAYGFPVRKYQIDRARASEGGGSAVTDMRTQQETGAAFQALHAGEPFVIPNPWDAGSARVLEALGFKALATTSAGFAFTLARLDGEVSLDEVAAHVSSLTAATDLPVSVDLENG